VLLQLLLWPVGIWLALLLCILPLMIAATLHPIQWSTTSTENTWTCLIRAPWDKCLHAHHLLLSLMLLLLVLVAMVLVQLLLKVVVVWVGRLLLLPLLLLL
jgi:hypothetical protein